MAVFAVQVRPAAQVRVATAPVPQQASPMAPHASQVRAAAAFRRSHAKPVPQIPTNAPVGSGQHGCPMPPQVPHVPAAAPLQARPALQVASAPFMPGQHASPMAPHARHDVAPALPRAQAKPASQVPSARMPPPAAGQHA
jgi:hypothetical protein